MKQKISKILPSILYGIAAAYLPCLLILVIFQQSKDGGGISMYVFSCLLLFLCSFPFYCVFFELVSCLCKRLYGKEINTAENVTDIIGTLVSICILLASVNFGKWLYFSLALTVTLIVVWIIRAIILRKEKREKAQVNKKILLLCTVAIIVAVCGVAAIVSSVTDSENKVDKVDGAAETTDSSAYFRGDTTDM